MKGRWESNINVFFPFMYSQKWNCAASLFPKHNYNVLSPSSYTHISVRYLNISSIDLSIAAAKYVNWSWEYINRSQTHEGETGTGGPRNSQRRTHKWNFRCSVARVKLSSLLLMLGIVSVSNSEIWTTNISHSSWKSRKNREIICKKKWILQISRARVIPPNPQSKRTTFPCRGSFCLLHSEDK